jgi:fucose 4-O-acetylase-like acetyltransferase
MRFKALDVAKGIGIILVIIGHLDTSEMLHKWIYSFHMPFFFFLSGFLNKDKEDFKEVAISKVKRLIVPYFFFGILSIIVMLTFKLPLKNPINKEHLDDILRIFYLKGNPIPMNKVIWFLIVLFWMEMLNFLLSKKISATAQFISSIVASVIVYYCFLLFKFRLPFGLDIVPFALIFFMLGRLVKQKIDISQITKTSNLWLLTFPIATIFLMLNFKFNLDLLQLTFKNPLLLVLTSFSGIYLLLLISFLISQNGILEYLGTNSIVILGTHIIIINLMKLVTSKMHIELNWFVYLTVILVSSYPIIFIVNRYLPWTIGAKKVLK